MPAPTSWRTLHFSVPKGGEYTIEIRDALYRGREDFVYRIAIGELPFVTSAFPLGGRACDLRGGHPARSLREGAQQFPRRRPARQASHRCQLGSAFLWALCRPSPSKSSGSGCRHGRAIGGFRMPSFGGIAIGRFNVAAGEAVCYLWVRLLTRLKPPRLSQ
jgi:hypothetical protein